MNALSRSLAVLCLCYLLLTLESPLLQELHLTFFAPDLALVVVVWVALNMSPVQGTLTCFFLGYINDGFVMAVPIGMHMEIFVVLFYVVRHVSSRVLVRGHFTLMMTTVIASLIASGLFALLSLLFDRTFDEFGLVFRLMVPVALVTAPFAPVVCYILDRADKTLFRKSRDSVFFS